MQNPSLASSGSRGWIVSHPGKLLEEENQTFPGPMCREQSQNSPSGKNSGSCPPTLFSESFPPRDAWDGEQNIPSPRSCPGAPPLGISPPPAPWNSISFREKKKFQAFSQLFRRRRRKVAFPVGMSVSQGFIHENSFSFHAKSLDPTGFSRRDPAVWIYPKKNPLVGRSHRSNHSQSQIFNGKMGGKPL